MSVPDLTRIDSSLHSFTLPTGAVRGLWNVTFDGSRFWYGSTDVTDYLLRAQKGAFPDYDPTADNLANYEARNVELNRKTNPGGSTSTLELFVEGVAKTIDPTNPGSLPAWLKPILITGGIVFGLWLLVKIVEITGFKFASK